jgi:hypothetical protein
MHIPCGLAIGFVPEKAIVNSKLRRMEREFELRGIRTRDPR